MGCVASKLDNEDAVRRCKERRRLMKQAVHARHHLAAAHHDYLHSLVLTATALHDFAKGEPLAVSDQTPAVLLHSSTGRRRRPSPSPPPPPPQRRFEPSPSPTIASSNLPPILSERGRSPPPPKKAFPKQQHHRRYPPETSSYASTPSQASSVWNWESFYPPSPPSSDFFAARAGADPDRAGSDSASSRSADDAAAERAEREEVQCSDWGDHDHDRFSTTTTSTSDAGDGGDDRDSKSEAPTRSEIGSEAASNFAPSRAPSISEKFARPAPEKSEAGYSAAPAGGGGELGELQLVVRHRNLAEIMAAIKDYFQRAAAAGEGVSDLLETSRAQFDRSFRQLKKTVYHSNSVLSNLSSTWTSRPPLSIRYKFDTAKLDVSGDKSSHCSTLERLLAWESKLYDEVKAREGVKIGHEKKLAALQRQEGRGRDQARLDKTKASIKKLQSLIVVTSQAVSATSTAVVDARDNQLAPQLVELCCALMSMWRSMNELHEVQNDIVQQVRGLVNAGAGAGDSTSELHRQATGHLESAVSAWHSAFCRLITYQRDYITSLHDWLKLSLHPVADDDPQSAGAGVATRVASDLFTFSDEWKQALDRVPDTVASEAIKSFVRVVHAIAEKQAEEAKVKKKAENTARELEKRSMALRNIERKFYQSYSMVGVELPDAGGRGGPPALDAGDPLSEKRTELTVWRGRVEDEMARHAKAVEVTRAMTLNNIQTGLPGVFQAMTGFSGVLAEALESVCRKAGRA